MITASYATTATQFSDVGGYAITATLSGSPLSNYTVVNAGNTLTITQAAQTISWATPMALTYGTPLSATVGRERGGSCGRREPRRIDLRAGFRGAPERRHPHAVGDGGGDERLQPATATVSLVVNQAT